MVIINKKMIKKLSNLTKLSFSEKEIDLFILKFKEIIKMFNSLNEVDTHNISFLDTFIKINNNFREDVYKIDNNKKNIFNNIIEFENNYLKIPIIINKKI